MPVAPAPVAKVGGICFHEPGGGDILHHASAFPSRTLDPVHFGAPAIIGRNMKEARRGLQDGVGFYRYDGVDLNACRAERMSDLGSWSDPVRCRFGAGLGESGTVDRRERGSGSDADDTQYCLA